LGQPAVSSKAPTAEVKINDHDDPRYYYNQALIFIENKNYTGAIELLEKSIAIAPDYLSALIALGSIHEYVVVCCQIFATDDIRLEGSVFGIVYAQINSHLIPF